MSPSLSRTNTNSSRITAHDKTSYGIIATPPSPTDTSPTLTHFSSNASPPSTASPRPSTPTRPSRSTARYPTDLGRVPLHRRGTSKTYERLEDLLREAGYKETRVFTPEGEHAEAVAERSLDPKPEREEDRRTSMREGMGAVVGFLSGLIPGGGPGRSSSLIRSRDDPAANATEQYPSSPRGYSPPASPLAGRQAQKQKGTTWRTGDSATSTNMSSSRESLGEPTPRVRHRPPSRSDMPPPSSTHSNTRNDHPHLQHQHLHRPSNHHVPSYASERYLRKQVSRSSLHQQVHSPNNQAGPSNLLAHPRPSRAGAYLRHMASAPHIPPRPSSTPGHRSRMTILLNDNDMDYGRGNGEGEEEHPQPPLPRTWLETVARAVLFGGSGAYVGGPSHAPPPPKPRENPDDRGRSQTLRATRSSLSQASRRRSRPPRHRNRTGLTDQTNAGHDFLAPPQLFMELERGRARGSVVEVSRTRVMCRSAPGSRASSAVRGLGEEKGRRTGKERGRDRGRREEKDRFPSLARTRTEGDPWARGRQQGEMGSAGGNRFLSGWGAEAGSDDDEDDPTERQSASSEEEDGELDLARILVPPKRQNSIKSLRKHLVSEGGSASASANLMRVSSGAGNRSGRGATAAGTIGSRNGSVAQRRRTEEDWDGEQEAEEEWGRGWVRGARRQSVEEDEEEDMFAGFLGEGRDKGGVTGSGRSTAGRSRLGLPAVWGRGS